MVKIQFGTNIKYFKSIISNYIIFDFNTFSKKSILLTTCLKFRSQLLFNLLVYDVWRPYDEGSLNQN